MNHDYCCSANINGGEPQDKVKTDKIMLMYKKSRGQHGAYLKACQIKFECYIVDVHVA